MRTQAEFRQFYERTLLPVLEPLEAERQQVAKKLLVSFWVIGLVALTIIGLVFLFHGEMMDALGFTGVIAVGAALAVYTLGIQGYRKNFKAEIIQPIVSFLDDSLMYQSEQRIEPEVYEESLLFQRSWDSYRGDDLVEGHIGDTHLRFSELHTRYKTVSSGRNGSRREQWHTIFKGLFFVADFNKHFEGSTWVLPDRAERTLGIFGKWLQENNRSRGELVALEDPEFEKQFVVYSSDQIEARYILSTSLMQRISAFQRKCGRQLYISFIDSRIFIAIAHQKDLFEPRVFHTLLDWEQMSEYFEDLLTALSIVEELNLNTRIWSKAPQTHTAPARPQL